MGTDLTSQRQTESKAREWACPRPGCNRVVSRLLEVRYAIGLTDLDAAWMCEADVEELRQEEADYTARGDFLSARAVWDVQVLRVRESDRAVAPARKSPRRPRRGAVEL